MGPWPAQDAMANLSITPEGVGHGSGGLYTEERLGVP